MTDSDTASLSRLLKRQAAPLLEAFEALLPDSGLALVEADGKLFVSTGNWSEASPAQMSAETDISDWLASTSDNQTLQNSNYRCYPLFAHSRPIGALVVYNQLPDKDQAPEYALHRSLELLLAQAVARRDIVTDALNRYREINLLYRVGETIGATLNPELIPQLALEESRRVIQADVGVEAGLFVMRRSAPSDKDSWENKASFGAVKQVAALIEVVRDKIDQLLDNDHPAIITDLPDNPLKYKAILWAPLKTPKQILGGILLGRLAGRPMFTANDEKLLMVLALQSALALENARLFIQTDEKLARRVKELTALQRIDRQLNRNLDYDHVLMLPAGFAAGYTNALRSRLLLSNQEGTSFGVVGHYPLDYEVLEGIVGRDDPLVARVLLSNRAQSAEIEEGGAIHTRLSVPILREGRVIGLLELVKKGTDAFDNDTLTFLTQFADHSALAIDNTLLYTAAQHEIAKRKQAEKSLRQHAVELEARNKELDAFAHTVAHDLKGPLSNIIGYSLALKEYWPTIPAEELQELLQTIAHNSYRMTNIIDELLLLASVREEEVQVTDLDMGNIIAGAKKRLVHMIEKYQAEIILPDTWPVAQGYGPWVEGVWTNYLSNAIKYGGRSPRIELGATILPAGMVRFWIRDNGAGITPKKQARLFTPFIKLDQIRTTGHGLGLSIVHRIVEKLGGQVGVESKINQGSIFYFTLPEGEQALPHSR